MFRSPSDPSMGRAIGFDRHSEPHGAHHATPLTPFIAATKDAKIRAFDKKTGKVLWQGQLPVPGYSTPATYSIDGRQYVVIACGGGKIGSKSGDQYIAFALPEKK